MNTSDRAGEEQPEAGVKFCGRSFVPIIKFDHRVGYRTDTFLLQAVVFSSALDARRIFGDREFGNAAQM